MKGETIVFRGHGLNYKNYTGVVLAEYIQASNTRYIVRADGVIFDISHSNVVWEETFTDRPTD